MKTRRSFLATLLALPLAASFVGASCNGTAIIPVVEASLQDAQMVISMIQASVDGYFAGHPNAALQTKIDAVITDTLSTLRLTESALAVANDLQAANVQAALQAFSDAFGQLVALIAQIGIQVKAGTGAKKLTLPDGTIVIEPPVILMHLKVKKMSFLDDVDAETLNYWKRVDEYRAYHSRMTGI